LEAILNLFVLQKVLNIIDFTYDKTNDIIDDFEGFLIGTIENNAVNIYDVKINKVELDSETDINLKMAIVEDEVYSTGSGHYIIGLFRSHNRMGLIPNPGDLVNLSTLQSLNPNAILMLFDIFEVKSPFTKDNLGFKFEKLEDPFDPNSNTIDIPYEVADFSLTAIQQILRDLKTQQIPYAKIDALVNKAKVNIQTKDYETAQKFLLEAKKLVGNKKDPDVAEKVDITLLEILYRKRDFKNLLINLEKLKKSFEESRTENLMGEIMLMLGRASVQMGKRNVGLKAFDEAVKYFEMARNWKKMAFSYLLKGLVLLPEGDIEKTLLAFFQGLSAISNLRSDQERDNLINLLSLEKNVKELIKTIPNKAKQNKYLNMLNEMSEKHGYKIVLSDF